MKIKHVRGYNHLLEYSEMKSLPCKSCSAITFTFNHPPRDGKKELKTEKLCPELCVKNALQLFQLKDYLQWTSSKHLYVIENDCVDLGAGGGRFLIFAVILGHERSSSSPQNDRTNPKIEQKSSKNCSSQFRSGASTHRVNKNKQALWNNLHSLS